MAFWIAWMIAIICAAAFVALWFREVRRVLKTRKSTVESAAGQLSVCQKKAAETPTNPDTAALLERSESIYRQAVVLYNDAVRNPWNSLPAVLMGFKEISLEEGVKI